MNRYRPSLHQLYTHPDNAANFVGWFLGLNADADALVDKVSELRGGRGGHCPRDSVMSQSGPVQKPEWERAV